MKEYSRSKETQVVVFKDGTKSKISHQLKHNIGQMYWYYVQFPCGRWVDFDIRILIEEGDIPNDTILSKKSLTFLESLLKQLSWDDFRFNNKHEGLEIIML